MSSTDRLLPSLIALRFVEREELVDSECTIDVVRGPISKPEPGLSNGFRLSRKAQQRALEAKAHALQELHTQKQQSYEIARTKGTCEDIEKYDWMQTPIWRKECRKDFIIENPAEGKLWLQDCIRLLYDPKKPPDYEVWDALNPVQKTALRDRLLGTEQFRVTGRLHCTKLTSSYCKYGENYRKNTSFLTSLSAVGLLPPCDATNRCEYSMKEPYTHPRTVQDVTDKAERNHVPVLLNFDLLRAFVTKHRHEGIKHFLVMDIFSGWGSVKKAVQQFKTSKDMQRDEIIFTYTNDINPNRGDEPTDTDLDLGKCPMKFLENMAMSLFKISLKNDKRKIFDSKKVAILYYCSFPCTTYSVAGGDAHRDAGEIKGKSKLSIDHDEMLKKVVVELALECDLLRPTQ